MSWDTGSANITAALAASELQRISGAQAAGAGWIADARIKLATAETVAHAMWVSSADRIVDAPRSHVLTHRDR